MVTTSFQHAYKMDNTNIKKELVGNYVYFRILLIGDIGLNFKMSMAPSFNFLWIVIYKVFVVVSCLIFQQLYFITNIKTLSEIRI